MVEGEATWIPSAITAASSLIAGFLGAGAVWLGARRTNEQALQIAREQRRYERVHEMRAQVLPQITADLRSLLDKLLEQTSVNAEEIDQVEHMERLRGIEEYVLEVYETQKGNILWLPPDVAKAMTNLLSGIYTQIEKRILPVYVVGEEGPTHSTQEIAETYKEVNEWFRIEGEKRFAELVSRCRIALTGE